MPIIADGNTDNALALQQAVNACLVNAMLDPTQKTRVGSAILQLPPGNIRTTQPLSLLSIYGLVVQGCGQNTTLIFDGCPTGLDLDGLAWCKFRDFRIRGTALTDGVSLQKTARSSSTTTQNRFHDVWVEGTFVNGWNIGNNSGASQVDNDLFVGCGATGQGAGPTNYQAAWLLGSGIHANCLNHTLLHCTGLSCKNGLQNEATNVKWIGGSLDECNVAVHHKSALPCHYAPLRIEGCQQLLVTGLAAPVLITMEGFEFRGESCGPIWIASSAQGVLTFRNIRLINPGIKTLAEFWPASETKGPPAQLVVILDGFETPYAYAAGPTSAGPFQIPADGSVVIDKRAYSQVDWTTGKAQVLP